MATGDTRYVGKPAWGFEYVCKEGWPFHTAMVQQGCDDNAAATAGKTRFPGSDETNENPNF